jgi:hypothetical protein
MESWRLVFQASFPSLPSVRFLAQPQPSTVGPGKDHARYPIRQLGLVKVQNQPDRNIQQLHVAEDLSLVDGQYFLSALEFQQQAILHQDVETQSLVEYQAFVLDPHHFLIDRCYLSKAQLVHQAPLVNAFQQARPYNPMNLDRGANDGVAQLIGPLVTRMHKDFLQKVTKETKKNFRVERSSIHTFGAVLVWFCACVELEVGHRLCKRKALWQS